MDIRNELIERFFRYLAIESQSDANSTALPSTPGQQRLAELLAGELRELGLEDVVLDDRATVTAVRRGTRPDAPKIGFIAHLDTVDVGLSPTIRPQILRFEGGDLCLNGEKDIWLRVDEHPEIRGWEGQDIIFSDGTSVLGADNKAAIAAIMTLLARLGPEVEHGDIFVAFVPDEEIGLRGAKALDLARFPCNFAYTIDCCELGEVVIETFNAAAAEIVFSGVSAHPMSAKGVLVNPLLMAMDFIAEFDPAETPERTEGREGYFWFKDLLANDTEARLKVAIRDFDKAGFERRKQRLVEAVELIRSRYPTGRASCQVADTYQNIGDHLGGASRSVELLFAALKALKIKPKLIPMRGGTDGAALSAQGLATPNFFTGAYNFHSRFEFLPVLAFEKSFEVARMICALAFGVHKSASGKQQSWFHVSGRQWTPEAADQLPASKLAGS
jgi:tripeptide aminopeptidase